MADIFESESPQWETIVSSSNPELSARDRDRSRDSYFSLLGSTNHLRNDLTRKRMDFPENETPPYVITSHRWSGEEITYRQFCEFCERKVDTQVTQMAGFKKVLAFCAFMRTWGKDLSCPSRHTSKPNSKGDCKHCFSRSFQCDQLKPKCSNCHHDSLPCEYDGPKAAEPTVEPLKENGKARTPETGTKGNTESEPSISTKSCKPCATANSICGKEVPSCSRCKEKNILCDYETALATSGVSERPEQITELQWIWIDTCCIDKGSSAELSETINSMFKWYQKAYACLAYLPDVRPQKYAPATILLDFAKSSWFTRGWTLQELLAPRLVIFLNQDWEVFGHKAGHVHISAELSAHKIQMPLNIWISRITGIKENILHDYRRIKDSSVSTRLKWMKGRTTTRIEDRAYCLLGICDVFMPLIYGEGERACDRLEHAINTESTGKGKNISGLRRRLMNQSSEDHVEQSNNGNLDDTKPVQIPFSNQNAPTGPFDDVPMGGSILANENNFYPPPSNRDPWDDSVFNQRAKPKKKKKKKNHQKQLTSKLETESHTLDMESHTLDRMLGGYSTTEDVEDLPGYGDDFAAPIGASLEPLQRLQDQFPAPYLGQQQPTAPFPIHIPINQNASTGPHVPLQQGYPSRPSFEFDSTFRPSSVWLEPEHNTERRRNRRRSFDDHRSSSASSPFRDRPSDRKHAQRNSLRRNRGRSRQRWHEYDDYSLHPSTRRRPRDRNTKQSQYGHDYDAIRRLEDEVNRLGDQLKKTQINLDGEANVGMLPSATVSKDNPPNVFYSSNKRLAPIRTLNEGLNQLSAEPNSRTHHHSLSTVPQTIDSFVEPHHTLPNCLHRESNPIVHPRNSDILNGSLSGRFYHPSLPLPTCYPPPTISSFYSPWYPAGPWALPQQAYPRPYEPTYPPG